jgi:hypothetical protein
MVPLEDDASARSVPAAAAFGVVAVVVLASFYLWFYSDCLNYFFALDDYWELREAQAIELRSPLDVWKFFRPYPFFLLYRPISTLTYFYAMRQLFGHDPTGYHATQLAFGVFNAVLVCGIASALLRSRPLGIATGLAYAASPGHAVSACWNASFTMTGTAFFYFAGLLVWLRTGPRWRTPLTTAVFVTALLASEHAISFPLSLTLVACLLQQRRDWRQLVREQAVFYVIAGLYAAVKLIYIRLVLAGAVEGPWLVASTVYALRLDPWLLLGNLGHYVGLAVSPLYELSTHEAWARALGAIFLGFAIGGTVLVATGRWTSLPLRVATVGLDLFVVALGPVLPLQAHVISWYVGISSLGSSLAIVALARAVPRLGAVAIPLVVATLILTHAASTLGLVRARYSTFFRAAEQAEQWVYTVAESARGRQVEEVVIPHHPVTQTVFVDGQAHRVLACASYRVRLSIRIGGEEVRPGTVVVGKPQPVPLTGKRGDRWSWMRAACANEPERVSP